MLSLKGCGYVLNDHYCEQIIRVNFYIKKNLISYSCFVVFLEMFSN